MDKHESGSPIGITFVFHSKVYLGVSFDAPRAAELELKIPRAGTFQSSQAKGVPGRTAVFGNRRRACTTLGISHQYKDSSSLPDNASIPLLSRVQGGVDARAIGFMLAKIEGGRDLGQTVGKRSKHSEAGIEKCFLNRSRRYSVHVYGIRARTECSAVYVNRNGVQPHSPQTMNTCNLTFEPGLISFFPFFPFFFCLPLCD
ncbi:hypothetical protein J3F83DRAFT_84377 [Trichoderma novae-zelandiae]